MKRHNIIIITLVFFGAALFAMNTVTAAMLGKPVYRIFERAARDAVQATSSSIVGCTSEAPLSDLGQATSPELKKLAEYQNACGSRVTTELMIFTDMPQSDKVAQDNAKAMAKKLKEFGNYKVTPIVIVEPVSTWGLIDFKEFESGFYDKWISQYFATLKSEGITESQMGVWVPFPEANLPYWNHANAKPEDFAAIVNKYLGTMKQYFPKAQGSVLLNSATYDNEDFDWRNGEYSSLVPFVEKLNPTLISSFGIQGFPWVPQAQDYGADVTDASEFLAPHLAIEAAKKLGVNKIWFNTGTFRAKYTKDAENTVHISAGERAAILTSILEQVKKTKAQGFEVSVNLFSEDKSSVAEATDWSYLASGASTDKRDTEVFENFLHDLLGSGIHFSMFDRVKE